MRYNLTLDRIIILMVLAFFLASLPFVAFELDYSSEGVSVYHDEWRGYAVLLAGWLGIFQKTIGWYANPFLFIGLALLRSKPKKAFIFGGSGLIIALSSLMLNEFWIDEHIVPHVSKWGASYYLWLSSFAVFLIGSGLCYYFSLKGKQA